MGYFADDFEMVEAATDNFKFTAGSQTRYSQEYNVSTFSTCVVIVNYAYSNRSGAIITPTLQVYSRSLDNWADYGADVTAADFQSDSQWAATGFSNLPTRVRLKAVSSGSWVELKKLFLLLVLLEKDIFKKKLKRRSPSRTVAIEQERIKGISYIDLKGKKLWLF